MTGRACEHTTVTLHHHLWAGSLLLVGVRQAVYRAHHPPPLEHAQQVASTAGELAADAIVGDTAEVLVEDQEDQVDQVALGVFLCMRVKQVSTVSHRSNPSKLRRRPAN